MSELTDKIRQRAYWLIEVAPATFSPDRVADAVALEEIARASAVRSRGWEYPFLDPKSPIMRFQDRIAAESTWDNHHERWEFYRSGLFIIMHAHPPDWRDASDLWPLREGETSPSSYLGITWTIGLLTDFYRFAARLAESSAGDSMMSVAVRLENIANRLLFGEERHRAPLRAEYRFNGQFVADKRIVEREDLVSRTHEIAMEVAASFFAQFGWRADPRILKDIQAELYR